MFSMKRLYTGKLLLELMMVVIVLLYLLPLWMVVTNSLKTQTAASYMNLQWPEILQFANYAVVIRESNAVIGLFNGLYLGFTSVLFIILFSSMAAFYFARINKAFSKFSYNYFISGLIIPGAVIPTYLVFQFLHLNNTYTGLIVLFVTGGLSFSVFLFTGFIRSIPRELDEAAIIDGSNPLQLFFKVIFPLLKPVTMTVALFNFIGVWNNVSNYLYFSNSHKWPLPLTVYTFFGKYSQSWNLVFADILIGIIPCLILFIAGQKYMVAGLTAGAVKG